MANPIAYSMTADDTMMRVLVTFVCEQGSGASDAGGNENTAAEVGFISFRLVYNMILSYDVSETAMVRLR